MHCDQCCSACVVQEGCRHLTPGRALQGAGLFETGFQSTHGSSGEAYPEQELREGRSQLAPGMVKKCLALGGYWVAEVEWGGGPAIMDLNNSGHTAPSTGRSLTVAVEGELRSSGLGLGCELGVWPTPRSI